MCEKFLFPCLNCNNIAVVSLESEYKYHNNRVWSAEISCECGFKLETALVSKKHLFEDLVKAVDKYYKQKESKTVIQLGEIRLEHNESDYWTVMIDYEYGGEIEPDSDNECYRFISSGLNWSPRRLKTLASWMEKRAQKKDW